MLPPRGSQQRNGWPPRASWLLPLLVLVVGFAATAAAAAAVDDEAGDDEARVLRSRANQVARAIDAQLQRYATLVENTAAMYATQRLDASRFEQYVGRIDLPDRYPGATGLFVPVRVTTAEVPALERQLRAETGITAPLDLAPADEHFIVVAQGRADGTDTGLGFDLAAAPQPAAALRAAAPGRPAVLSAPYVLLIDRELPAEQRQLSFIFAARVPSDAGPPAYLALGLHGADFLTDALRTQAGDLQVELVDTDGTVGSPVVVARAGERAHDRMSVTIPVDARGRDWDLVARPGPGLFGRSSAPLLAAGGGVAITLLVAAVMGLLIGQRRRALALVERTTERLRESERRFRSIFDNSPVGLYEAGPDFTIFAANSRLAELLGTPVGEIVGCRVSDLAAGQFRAEAEAALATVARGERDGYQAERRFTRPDGVPITVLATVTAIRDVRGGIDRLLGVVTDETERVSAREALLRANAELAAANTDLEGFAGVVAHDLKSPLVGIGGFAQLLRRAYDTSLDERGLGFVQHIEDGVERMSSLIDDLLAYASAGNVELVRHETQLADVVGSVIPELGARIDVTSAHIELGSLPTLDIDAVLVRQLFVNLIGNAIKYVRPGERPRVRIDSVAVGGVDVVRVTDCGIGVPAEQRDEVFEPFSRSAEARQSYPGTGLGLAICVRVVERHGGRIGLVDTPGGGASFWFTLAPSHVTTADLPAPVVPGYDVPLAISAGG